MTWAQKIGPIGPKTPSNGRKCGYENGIEPLYSSVLKSNEEYRGSMPFSYPHFRPFEGVFGPIGPIFGAQVIWSLAPMALMQKKRVKST